ncbi:MULTISPECIES: ABC transporter permease [unclassified Leifsonia]|uniref:ABC transporter permease n=1 Tax=unclassified Leifsonia TaxID=2663824 RepID=UPI00092A9F1A|nr:ABC transporter permease [Leifsonia sp. 71-9]OJX77177.1 MAG: ABC transporter permease [Leifsonia sp. 71-9]
MVSFIARRVGVSILILVAASFIMYVLTAGSGNPLQDLQGSSSPNKQALIDARVHAQHLDLPSPVRWLLWLGGVARCIVPLGGACDLGTTFQNQSVAQLLPQAMAATLQLVVLAFVLAVILGVALGIVTALRAYSGFDYSITLVSFFLFSLPAFLVAVLLKTFVAIGYNNFLADPVIGIPSLILIAVIVGLIVQLITGGTWGRRGIVFLIAAVLTAGILAYMSATDWFLKPSLGPVVVIVFCVAIGLAVVALLAGLNNRKAWLTAGINVVVAIICYFSLQGLLNVSSLATLVILGVVAIVVGLLVGFFVGGYDRGLMMRIGAITAFFTSGVIVIDRLMRSWPAYLDITNGRPIATVGSQTPGLEGDVWITSLDSFTHLLLPTLSLLAISFAGYTRYARSGMLEVLNQDYVRTARAKGLPERTVVVRHAFRNMLIPITTLVATDIGALLGGAVITENVFGISGMGQLFITGLFRTDVNPVMGYFLVIAITAIVFNFLADLTYSVLDPRVRVR